MYKINTVFGLPTLAILWLLLAVACGSGFTPALAPTPTPELPALQLPADEAPHGFQTEWWYFNLHLLAEDGSRYSLHDVVFQVTEPESQRVLYVAQVGFSNAQTAAHLTGERGAVAMRLPVTTDPGFDLRVGSWLMKGTPGKYRLKADLTDVSFDLTLTATEAVLLHNGDGLVDFGEAAISYYYSRPRLAAAGTLTVDGQQQTVNGLGWMDKQWGDIQPVAIAWDWASVQLDSGDDLMLTRLMEPSGTPLEVYGTWGRADGTSVHLDGAQFTFEPVQGESWTSPATGATYPTVWRVTVPSAGVDVTLKPLAISSEFVSGALGVIYWEAGATVSGSHTGQGFIELTGGAPDLP
jgi:predicted secreted hydrolase